MLNELSASAQIKVVSKRFLKLIVEKGDQTFNSWCSWLGFSDVVSLMFEPGTLSVSSESKLSSVKILIFGEIFQKHSYMTMLK